MYDVDHYELIRRKHFVDGMSQREIARQLGHSRKFVKKALENPVPTGYRLTAEKPKPTLGPVVAVIDVWLEKCYRPNCGRIRDRIMTVVI